jgi:hypothetical protein
MKGQKTPTEKGATAPDKTQMSKVAGVASGPVGSKGLSHSMPKAKIDKLC